MRPLDWYSEHEEKRERENRDQVSNESIFLESHSEIRILSKDEEKKNQTRNIMGIGLSVRN